MSRQTVLALLRERMGEPLSGEELSQQLGISRTAVWKAINTLRQEGYTIEARTGQGYRLTGVPDALTEPEIRSFLTPVERVGRRLYCYDQVDSTNTRVKQLALEGAEDGTVVVANCQTAGRGRMNRVFQSPRGQGIYLTALLRPQLPPDRLMMVTAMAGVAVCEAVEQVCGVRPGLKWPNDPVMNGKKLCGILTELSLEGESGRLQYLAVGIGVNVGQKEEDFSPEVRPVATSLLQELGRPVSRPALAAAEIEALDRLYTALLSGDTAPYLAACRRDCVNLGRPVQLMLPDGTRQSAVAEDLDEDFGLVVRLEDGSRRIVRSGEVSVRGLYGYVE